MTERTDDTRPREDGAPDRDAGPYSQAHGREADDRDGRQQHVRVLEERRSQDLRNRWNEVQTAFVDEPRQAVTDADQLVGEVLDEVSRVFRAQRADLEKGWGERNEPGTEELRQALFRYREFFDRLLSL